VAEQTWEKLKEIFHFAIALGPGKRGTYLDRACDGDASLRHAVESLIKSHEESGFVDQPLINITYDVAGVYALQGKTDEAVKWLRTTAETGFPNYPLFARDPYLDRIADQPGFIQFMSELKRRWDIYKQEVEKPAGS